MLTFIFGREKKVGVRAQLYDDSSYVRIFGTNEMLALMDCYSDATAPIGTDVADMILKRCGFRRSKKWIRFDKMFETSVSFKR